MDYFKFESQLLFDISNNNNTCLNQIEQNKDLIDSNLNENGNYIENFVNKLNDIIIKKTDYDFNLIDSILKHSYFIYVLKKFQESDIIVRAISLDKEQTVDWLLTYDINPCIQNELGMTALMYAVKNKKWLKLVRHYLETSPQCLNIADQNGETALFHSLQNEEALKLIVQNKDTNNNHINNNGDNVFLYCCKNNIMGPLKIISYTPIDYNVVDREGRTVAMYLADKGRFLEFQYLVGSNVDIDYKNKKEETVLSILIKRMNQIDYTSNPKLIIPFIRILMNLVQMECNFNVRIDEEGNTPLMFFIMIKDYCSINYIITYNRGLNVSLTNKKGVSAFVYALKDGNPSLIDRIMRHKTFNFEYYDKYHNNLLINYTCNSNMGMIKEIMKNRPHFINEVNYRQENALILAVKLNLYNIVQYLLTFKRININQQDIQGNTALHYAVHLSNEKMVCALAFAGADINICNEQGESPFTLAQNHKNKSILYLMQHPTRDIKPLIVDDQKDKKKSKLLFFKIRKNLKKDKIITRKNIELCIYSLGYSRNEDIVKFDTPDVDIKYMTFEPYETISEIIKNTYNRNNAKDYSNLTNGLKAAGAISLGDVLVEGVLEAADIVGDIIGNIAV